ncbi:hypothetical protein OAP83_02910 [Rickettsiales bacterium]|nr:hypothetical protein [Rickettsiales bacterium]
MRVEHMPSQNILAQQGQFEASERQAAERQAAETKKAKERKLGELRARIFNAQTPTSVTEVQSFSPYSQSSTKDKQLVAQEFTRKAVVVTPPNEQGEQTKPELKVDLGALLKFCELNVAEDTTVVTPGDVPTASVSSMHSQSSPKQVRQASDSFVSNGEGTFKESPFWEDPEQKVSGKTVFRSLNHSPIAKENSVGSVGSSIDLGEGQEARIQELERLLAAKNLELQTQKYIKQFKDFFATAYEEHETTSDNVFWPRVRSKLCLDQFYKMGRDIDFDESKFLNLFKKAAEWLEFDGFDQYATLQETYIALHTKLREVDVDENSIIGDLEREIFAPEGQFDKYNGLVKSSIYASEIALFLTKQILDQEAKRVAAIKIQRQVREWKEHLDLSSAAAQSQSQKVIQPLAIDAEVKSLLNELSHIYSAGPMYFLAEYFVQTMSEVGVDDKASMANFYKELTFLFKSLTAQELSEALTLSSFDEGRLKRLAKENPLDYKVNRQSIENKPFFEKQPFADQLISQSQGQIILNKFFEQMQRLMQEFDEAKQDVFYNSDIRNSDEQSLAPEQASYRDMVSEVKYQGWLR